MAAISSSSRNFYTEQYAEFQQEMGVRLGDNTIIKSWQVFNRCILEPSEQEDEKRCERTYSDLTLPADNQQLQKKLLAKAAKKEELKDIFAKGVRPTDEYVSRELFKLPLESKLRQQVAPIALLCSPKAQEFLALKPQNASILDQAAADEIEPAKNQEDLEQREARVRAQLLWLPFASQLAQANLEFRRAEIEAEISGRLAEFKQVCETLLTPDPAEYPGGNQPIEQEASLVYELKDREDALYLMTYERTFAR